MGVAAPSAPDDFGFCAFRAEEVVGLREELFVADFAFDLVVFSEFSGFNDFVVVVAVWAEPFGFGYAVLPFVEFVFFDGCFTAFGAWLVYLVVGNWLSASGIGFSTSFR